MPHLSNVEKAERRYHRKMSRDIDKFLTALFLSPILVPVKLLSAFAKGIAVTKKREARRRR